MRVLAVNTGSSSLKLTLLDGDDRVLADQHLERWEHADERSIAEMVSVMDRPDAVGHRVVHGGRRFTGPVQVDEGVEEGIADLESLAPLHQFRAVSAIRAVRAALPDVPAVACFDTAFHSTLPAEAATYAIPRTWQEAWGLRRYGFHGLSHARAVRRAAEILDRSGDATLRVVSCHLGAGASLCAALGGRSIDTTMGFTPLEGLVMATRSGSVDPGMVLWLITDAGLSAEEVSETLRVRSGVAGLTEGSGDMRDVLARRHRREPLAVAAFDVYLHSLVREIAAMTATLGGIDVLVFTGGVGEHSPEVRAAASSHLTYLGVSVDDDRNSAATGTDAEIGTRAAPVRTIVVRAREDLEIARQTRRLLGEDR